MLCRSNQRSNYVNGKRHLGWIHTQFSIIPWRANRKKTYIFEGFVLTLTSFQELPQTSQPKKMITWLRQGLNTMGITEGKHGSWKIGDRQGYERATVQNCSWKCANSFWSLRPTSGNYCKFQTLRNILWSVASRQWSDTSAFQSPQSPICALSWEIGLKLSMLKSLPCTNNNGTGWFPCNPCHSSSFQSAKRELLYKTENKCRIWQSLVWVLLKHQLESGSGRNLAWTMHGMGNVDAAW